MRLITNNDKFDYVLLCNKICGVAHYNMRMKLVIESEADFKKWYATQNYVFARPEVSAPATPVTVVDSTKTAEAAVTPNKVIASKK